MQTIIHLLFTCQQLFQKGTRGLKIWHTRISVLLLLLDWHPGNRYQKNVKKHPTGSPVEGEWRGSWKLPPKTQIKIPQAASLPSILEPPERKHKASHNSLTIFQTHTKPGCLVVGLRPCTHLGNFIQQFVVFLSFLKSAQIAAHSKKQRGESQSSNSPRTERQVNWKGITLQTWLLFFISHFSPETDKPLFAGSTSRAGAQQHALLRFP